MATTNTVEVKAIVRYLPVSPTKVRPVLDLVRGLPAEDAERLLQITPRDAAGDILKVLESAIANAEHNNQIPVDELYLTRCWADEGPTRPGGRARARGRSFKIRHRTSHIVIVLARYEEDELERRRRRLEESGTGRASVQRKRSERVRASRRAATVEHDHDHEEEHDHEHDHDHAQEEAVSVAVLPEVVGEPEASEQVDEETE
jgi:large subunit ribosomal protein L22